MIQNQALTRVHPGDDVERAIQPTTRLLDNEEVHA
jgi:hypothetical protein